MTRAVENVEHLLAPAVVGCLAEDQQAVDQRLVDTDDTPQKTKAGANAILGVSLAAAHAAAAAAGEPLFGHLNRLYAAQAIDGNGPAPRMPLPMTNMISGGLHAGGNLDFQDVLVIPHAAGDYPTGLEWIVRVYRRLGERLRAAGHEGWLVGDEGGYGPRLASNEQALEIVVAAIEDAGFVPGDQVSLAVDVASSHFYADGHYQLRAGGVTLDSQGMVEHLAALVERFPVRCLEDGLAEDDWEGWQQLQNSLGDRVALVGDDLFATNTMRIQHGIDRKAANAVLIKVNQIGTLSETFGAMQLASAQGWTTVVSARSGETEDTTIADLAVATAADYIKIGSIVRSERLAKYNQLLRLHERLQEA